MEAFNVQQQFYHKFTEEITFANAAKFPFDKIPWCYSAPLNSRLRALITVEEVPSMESIATVPALAEMNTQPLAEQLGDTGRQGNGNAGSYSGTLDDIIVIQVHTKPSTDLDVKPVVNGSPTVDSTNSNGMMSDIPSDPVKSPIASTENEAEPVKTDDESKEDTVDDTGSGIKRKCGEFNAELNGHKMKFTEIPHSTTDDADDEGDGEIE